MAKQRQVRIEQGLPPSLMEDMQDRTDEQLESESKHRSIALALLGARAAERYDAAAARTYFQRAIAAARPQERIQIRRMADASLALAERRADDLKHAVEKLGQAPPSGRALMGLRLMGLIAPPPGAGPVLRLRGFAIVALLIVGLLAAGLGVVELIWLVFTGGGIGLAPGLLLGLIVIGVALAVLTYFGRRRQKAARAGGKGTGAAKGSAPGKVLAAARRLGAARAAEKAGGVAAGTGAAATKSSGAAAKVPPRPKGASPAKAPAQPKGGAAGKKGAPSSAGGATARRGGTPRGTGTAKGAAPAKPAKGAGGSSRPKRPSR